MEIVATTSLPAVDRPNADRWNAARSRQLNSPEHAEWKHFEEKNSKFHNGILLLTQAYHMVAHYGLYGGGV